MLQESENWRKGEPLVIPYEILFSVTKCVTQKRWKFLVLTI